jgi:hypothetical protein
MNTIPLSAQQLAQYDSPPCVAPYPYNDGGSPIILGYNESIQQFKNIDYSTTVDIAGDCPYEQTNTVMSDNIAYTLAIISLILLAIIGYVYFKKCQDV